jgi:hypothetical protein
MRKLWILAAVLAACSQGPTGSVNDTIPASADTQSKTAVRSWKVQGSAKGGTVLGVDTGGKVYRKLEVSVNGASSLTGVQHFYDASGAEVASLTGQFDAEGKAQGKSLTGDPTDPALCPGCMAADLQAKYPPDPSSASVQGGVTAQLDPTKCANNQAALMADVAALIANGCVDGGLYSLVCAAIQAQYALDFKRFGKNCGGIF